VEELIKQLNEKEIYVHGKIRHDNKIFQINLYTQPDREIITIKCEKFTYYMEISLFSTHASFEEKQTKVYEDGKDIIYHFIMNEFQKSDCLFLFYKSETNHLFQGKGFSLEHYFEESPYEASSFINTRFLTLYRCIEKYPNALTNVLDFSSHLEISLKQLKKEEPTYSFLFNARFQRMALTFYYKGVQCAVTLFRKKDTLVFRYETYNRELEELKYEDQEFSFSSLNDLTSILKTYMDSCYKKERLRLVSNPSRYYFKRVLRRNLYQEPLYNALLSHFSPEELERYSFDLYTSDKQQVEEKERYENNDSSSLILYRFGDFWFVSEKSYEEEKSSSFFLYMCEKEARAKFYSLFLTKFNIS